MKWYFKLLISLVIICLVLGLAQWEASKWKYPSYVKHHQEIMQKISTNEYLVRLQYFIGFGRAIDFDGLPTREDYFQLLRYLGQNLNYTTEPIIRHEDPIEILEYGLGRCGEFAIAFTALCLANAWEARIVLDITDHVWVEVWDNEWRHVDPTEGAKWTKANPEKDIYENPYVNDPEMYERDWKKELKEVWAIEAYYAERVEKNYQYNTVD